MVLAISPTQLARSNGDVRPRSAHHKVSSTCPTEEGQLIIHDMGCFLGDELVFRTVAMARGIVIPISIMVINDATLAESQSYRAPLKLP
jgi:hypothetical protein